MIANQDYRSYLLRLWRLRDDGERWRIALESVEDGERRGFDDLDDLVAFLRHAFVLTQATEASQAIDESQM